MHYDGTWLYISDYHNQRVMRWKPFSLVDKERIVQTVAPGTEIGKLHGPSGVTVSAWRSRVFLGPMFHMCTSRCVLLSATYTLRGERATQIRRSHCTGPVKVVGRPGEGTIQVRERTAQVRLSYFLRPTCVVPLPDLGSTFAGPV